MVPLDCFFRDLYDLGFTLEGLGMVEEFSLSVREDAVSDE